MKRLRLYSLKTFNDKSILNFDLTGLIDSETFYNAKINLPSGTVFLSFREYLNKMKVYDDGECFFIMCTKKVSLQSAKECLMKYAIDKVDKTLDTLTTRVNKLNDFKQRLQSEMIAA
jgi:hypothetical protein